MYESYYGLKEKPFNLLPDPQYLYMSAGHENAFTHLEYAITENKGFVVVTGEIGSGKTTLINYLLQKIPQDVNVAIVNNTDVGPLQLLKMVCQEFELEAAGLDKAEMLDKLNQYLVEQYALRRRVVLIVDEAQNLPKKTMEEIRMLSNLEADKHHLIQIILVGQPELRAKMQARGLEQLVQRVTIHCHLEGLRKGDVRHYIHHRLRVAGAKDLNIFNAAAIEALHQYSRGIPRLINILCDVALVYGYADDQKVIDDAIIHSVVEARQIGGILTKEEPEPEKTAESEAPTVKTKNLEEVEKRLDSLEQRMFYLEATTQGLDQKLHSWLEKREERDSGLLELVRLLRDSLRGRQRLLAKYLEMKKMIDDGASLGLTDDPETKVSFIGGIKAKERIK
jgi:general secretion pathway protein A